MTKFYDPFTMKCYHIQKLDDDTFRIKINLQLRRIGVIDILFSRSNLEIFANNFNTSVPNYGDLTKILDETYEQLLNPDDNLPAYVIKIVWEYISSLEVELELIVSYFEWNTHKNDI